MGFDAGITVTGLYAKRNVKRTARHKRIEKALFMFDTSFMGKLDRQNHTTIEIANLAATERSSESLSSSLSAFHLLCLGHGF